MQNKVLVALIVTIIGAAGAVVIFLTQKNMSDQRKAGDAKGGSAECADCGTSGWQVMGETCGADINFKVDFRDCLASFSWSSVDAEMEPSEIREGYIEIGGTDVLTTPTPKSIEAFIFHQWAADPSGKLYLLEQPG